MRATRETTFESDRSLLRIPVGVIGFRGYLAP
jgi:hypothetical protein